MQDETATRFLDGSIDRPGIERHQRAQIDDLGVYPLLLGGTQRDVNHRTVRKHCQVIPFFFCAVEGDNLNIIGTFKCIDVCQFRGSQYLSGY